MQLIFSNEIHQKLASQAQAGLPFFFFFCFSSSKTRNQSLPQCDCFFFFFLFFYYWNNRVSSEGSRFSFELAGAGRALVSNGADRKEDGRSAASSARPRFYHSPDEYPPGGTRVRAGTFAAGDVSFDFSLEFELDVPFCTAGPLFCDSAQPVPVTGLPSAKNIDLSQSNVSGNRGSPCLYVITIRGGSLNSGPRGEVIQDVARMILVRLAYKDFNSRNSWRKFTRTFGETTFY